MSYSQLSYDIGWDCYNLRDYQRLHSPVAKRGKFTVYLCCTNYLLYLKFLDRHGVSGNIKIKVRTVSELNDAKSFLINNGFNLNWETYQSILEMYNEHFKVYAPYIK